MHNVIFPPDPFPGVPLVLPQAWQDLSAAPKHLCLLGWREEAELPKPQLCSIPVCVRKEGVNGDSAPHAAPEQGTLLSPNQPCCLAHRQCREQAGRKPVTVPEKQVCQNFKGI